MIAPLDATNTFGLQDRSAKWQYLVRFAFRQGVSPEKIMKDKLPVDFPTTTQLLESVRDRIAKYYPTAHPGVLEMGGRSGGPQSLENVPKPGDIDVLSRPHYRF
jgi:hypothetical protein